MISTQQLYPLYTLAEKAGVRTAYRDSSGFLRCASPEALVAVLRALGLPVEAPDRTADAFAALEASTPPLDPVHVAWGGRLPPLPLRTAIEPARVTIQLEDGDAVEPIVRMRSGSAEIHVDRKLPLGVHSLEMMLGREPLSTRIISAPARLADPRDERGWGIFLPLHAFGSAARGPGTYEELRAIADWIAELGGAWLGTLPLLAALLDEPFEPSPYAPASRLFWNEVFLDAGWADAGGARERLLDYREAADRLRPQLQARADAFFAAGGEDEPAFREFIEAHPLARDYARFRAVCDRERTGWPAWPEPLRTGELREGDFEAAHEHRHLYAAWQAEEQMAALADAGRSGRSARLYLDLPLGIHPDGYDAWRFRKLFAEGISVGAPPDALFRGGQDWGFHPVLPAAQRADGYAYLRSTLRHHLRHAGALRIDHVMSLGRLYWIPRGFPPTEGVYVRYPREELFALHVLEASRHGAQLVGEDLGTVPPVIRTTLEKRGLLRMFVAQFEFTSSGGIGRPPPRSVASLNTHDTPTFAGFWRGAEIAEQRAMDLIDARTERRALRERARLRQRAAETYTGGYAAESTDREDADRLDAVMRALLRHLAATDARMLLITLEDLWLEPDPQNVPGTGAERPNWRRRARHGIADVITDADIRALLLEIDALRRDGNADPVAQ